MTPRRSGELVERFRDGDGRVRWEWELIWRLRGEHRERDELDLLFAPLERELRDAGFEIATFEEWASGRLPDAASARRAAPILLRWFAAAGDPRVRGAVARALDDPRLRKQATGPLLDAFAELTDPDFNGTGRPDERVARLRLMKDAIAHAIGTLARDEHFEQVAALLRDGRHDPYRAYLLWALPYMRTDAAVDLALELLDDEAVHVNALRALADLRSERGEAVLAPIAAEAKPRGRSDEDQDARTRIDIAQGGLDKLAKARAKGRSRP